MLTMQGNVKSVIEVRPASAISFRGLADQMKENTVDIVSTAGQPFHIQRVESNLDEKISYQLETVEDGKHYRLRVSNLVKQGNYNGFIKAHTDLPQKSNIVMRVSGYIEGDISVKPQTVLVGKLSSQQPVRQGKVIVTSNRDKPFKITRLTYDEQLIQVTQQPIPNEQGVSLEITPQLANIPAGSRQQCTISIETDSNPEENYKVQVHVMNAADAHSPAAAPKPESDPNPTAQPNPPGPDSAKIRQ